MRKSRELEVWSAAKLVEQYGPIEPFIETAEYAVDQEMFDELSALPEQDAIQDILEWEDPITRGYWGNIEHLPFVTLQHAVDWTGIGNEHGLPPEVVASIIPSPP